jgi:hypothetical protein
MHKCLVGLQYDPDTNKPYYICRKGLNITKLSINSERCWRYRCPGIRKIELNTCNYLNCNQTVRNTKGAKYCSLKCKSKESSRLYRLKKKNELRTL